MRSSVGRFPPRGLREELFNLQKGGLSEESRALALTEFQRYVVQQQENFLGYQANQNLQFGEALAPYLNCQLNNLGDPFHDGNFTLNTKCMERAVLEYYAHLWHAKCPYDEKAPDSYWGYVMSMGSSEANLYGLWNARDYLGGKILLDDTDVTSGPEDAEGEAAAGRWTYRRAAAPEDNPRAYTPVAFYSEDSHYSITKAAVVLGLKTFHQMGSRYFPLENPLSPGKPWPQEVPSNRDGSIDIDQLKVLVEFFARRGYPILVSFNYGTTFKGAYDDVEAAGNAILPILDQYGLGRVKRKVLFDPDGNRVDLRTGFWFHVDGALGAAYMPFREMAFDQGLVKERGPRFDFGLPFVHSISMSGHKWIGAPWPCGIYMTKREYQLLPPERVDYIGSLDTTFAGSRNGFSSLLLWDYLARYSYEQQIEKLVASERISSYAEAKLKELGDKLGEDLWVERSPLALTVRFKRASEDMIFKYSLSCDRMKVDGEWRDYSHIFLMEHVTPHLIDSLVDDLLRKGRFPVQPAGGGTVSIFPNTGRGYR
jgi:histidine decarboxylase